MRISLGLISISIDSSTMMNKIFELIEAKKIFNLKKKVTKNKSIQSLKYSFIERLKRINCPEEIISEIIGLKKRNIFYKNEVSVEMKYSWLNQIIE